MASEHGKTLFKEENLAATTTSGVVEVRSKDVNFVAFLKLENNSSANFAIKIEHSPNGVDWFTLLTFVATGGNTTEKINLDNTTNHVMGLVRAVATRTAGSADFTIVLLHDRV